MTSQRAEQQFEHDLIEAIKARPFLYDHSHPKNKHTLTKAVAWKEIANICGESAERCLSRWKSLRDRYLREWKIQQKTKRKPRWVYYESLTFLQKFLKTVNNPDYKKKTAISTESQSTSANIEYDQMETSAEENYSTQDIFNVKQELNNSTTLNNSFPGTSQVAQQESLRKPSTNKNSGNVTRSNELSTLDEPEIDFDVVGTLNRFNDTIKTYKEVITLRFQRTEDENFGALVADMLSTLTIERRTRAKAHLMQYLADLHLQQMTQDI